MLSRHWRLGARVALPFAARCSRRPFAGSAQAKKFYGGEYWWGCTYTWGTACIEPHYETNITYLRTMDPDNAAEWLPQETENRYKAPHPDGSNGASAAAVWNGGQTEPWVAGLGLRRVPSPERAPRLRDDRLLRAVLRDRPVPVRQLGRTRLSPCARARAIATSLVAAMADAGCGGAAAARRSAPAPSPPRAATPRARPRPSPRATGSRPGARGPPRHGPPVTERPSSTARRPPCDPPPARAPRLAGRPFRPPPSSFGRSRSSSDRAGSGDRPAGQARALLAMESRERRRLGEGGLLYRAARRLPGTPGLACTRPRRRLPASPGSARRGLPGHASECVQAAAALRGYLMELHHGARRRIRALLARGRAPGRRRSCPARTRERTAASIALHGGQLRRLRAWRDRAALRARRRADGPQPRAPAGTAP